MTKNDYLSFDLKSTIDFGTYGSMNLRISFLSLGI